MGREGKKLNFQRVVTVSGLPGLYFLRSHNKVGYLLEPLAGGGVQFVSNSKDKVAALGNIDLALQDGSIPVVQIFKLLNEVDLVPSHGATDPILLDFFKQLIPQLNSSKVYPSTLKKVLHWYGLLVNYLSKDSIQNSINEEEEESGLRVV